MVPHPSPLAWCLLCSGGCCSNNYQEWNNPLSPPLSTTPTGTSWDRWRCSYSDRTRFPTCHFPSRDTFLLPGWTVLAACLIAACFLYQLSLKSSEAGPEDSGTDDRRKEIRFLLGAQTLHPVKDPAGQQSSKYFVTQNLTFLSSLDCQGLSFISLQRNSLSLYVWFPLTKQCWCSHWVFCSYHCLIFIMTRTLCQSQCSPVSASNDVVRVVTYCPMTRQQTSQTSRMNKLKVSLFFVSPDLVSVVEWCNDNDVTEPGRPLGIIIYFYPWTWSWTCGTCW